MVSEKMGRRQTLPPRFDQKIQYFPARRTTVDVVTEEKDPAVPSWLLSSVLGDPVMKPKQEIQSAMDIAHDIESTSGRSLRWPTGFLPSG